MDLKEFLRLDHELTAAREAYRGAQAEARRIEQLVPEPPPLNHGSAEALHFARRAVRESWDKYQVALKAYSDYRGRR
jgi:hypothetical protein